MGLITGRLWLGYGTLIDGSLSYKTNGGSYSGVDISSGYWAVKFNQGNGNYNYGWVQVDVNDSGMTFGLAAVNTTLNESITAGELITAGTAPVPEPSQVAASILLIGGIAGFVIVRRRKALALVA